MYHVGEKLSRPKEGLLGNLVKHKGIATGMGTVIHACKSTGCVIEDTLDVFGKGQSITSEGRPLFEQGMLSVCAARTQIGKPYNVLKDNCEHLVNCNSSDLI